MKQFRGMSAAKLRLAIEELEGKDGNVFLEFSVLIDFEFDSIFLTTKINLFHQKEKFILPIYLLERHILTVQNCRIRNEKFNESAMMSLNIIRQQSKKIYFIALFARAQRLM